VAEAAARLPRPRRRRRWLIIAIASAVALIALLGGLSGFYIDLLWFREVGLSPVFASILWTKIVLVLLFGLVFFAVLYANLLIVRRTSPRYRLFSPEQEVIDRYRQAADPYMRWILPGLSLLLALFAAASVAGLWREFLLWRNGAAVQFGVNDPVFQRDLSFYVFRLPFLHFVQGWLFSSLVVITVVTAAAHYLWGGIRFQAIGEKVTPVVKAHLSVLLGVIMLVKAWGYRLGQFDLLSSERGVVTGASYTDVNAQLPALRILVPIAILVAVLFLVNIRFRGWALPILGIGLLALASIAAGAAYPAFVQKFRVDPQPLEQERPYIERNIEFTRRAFGLDGVEPRRIDVQPDLTKGNVDDNPQTVSNIRLWEPALLQRAYQSLQQIRPYYSFEDVDVDRYTLPDGTRRVVMVSGREIAQSGIPEESANWQNRHLFFTHGYGYVASRVDRVSTEGQPDFLVRGIPPGGVGATSGDLAVGSPPGPLMYYGENEDVGFVVVKTRQKELDRPGGQGVAEGTTTTYAGEGGIDLGGLFRRLAFAWHYRDVNLLISNLISPDSRILINRDIEDRVRKAAPFLDLDHDPYMAVVDGRLAWIWDAYTTSDAYPYSTRLHPDDLVSTDGGPVRLPGSVNYIRNSVKIAVDAYDGTMTFYIVDPEDPIVQVWQKAFPELFAPASAVSPGLRAHFRYPEDLFTLQAEQYARYHVTDPDDFFSSEDFWAVPNDPNVADSRVKPYYVLMRLPGDTEEEFVLFTPFTPRNRPNMIAWLAARSDPDAYGRITQIEFEGGQTIFGPEQVAARINQDPTVSQQLTLLNQQGSTVQYGPLLAIPIEESFLYVQPLFLEASAGGGGAIPELQRVVVVHGESVTIGDTLQETIAQSFGLEPQEPGGGEPPGQTIQELLDQASRHFARADRLLRQGDLAGYQSEIDLARAAVEQALELAQGPDGGPPASPTPSPSATG